MPTSTERDPIELLAAREPGEAVKLTVYRGKRKRTFRFELCDAAVQAGLGE